MARLLGQFKGINVYVVEKGDNCHLRSNISGEYLEIKYDMMFKTGGACVARIWHDDISYEDVILVVDELFLQAKPLELYATLLHEYGHTLQFPKLRSLFNVFQRLSWGTLDGEKAADLIPIEHDVADHYKRALYLSRKINKKHYLDQQDINVREAGLRFMHDARNERIQAMNRAINP